MTADDPSKFRSTKTSRQNEQKHRSIIVQSNSSSRLLIISDRRIKRKLLNVTFSYHFHCAKPLRQNGATLNSFFFWLEIWSDTCIFKQNLYSKQSYITNSVRNITKHQFLYKNIETSQQCCSFSSRTVTNEWQQTFFGVKLPGP